MSRTSYSIYNRLLKSRYHLLMIYLYNAILLFCSFNQFIDHDGAEENNKWTGLVILFPIYSIKRKEKQLQFIFRPSQKSWLYFAAPCVCLKQARDCDMIITFVFHFCAAPCVCLPVMLFSVQRTIFAALFFFFTER